MLNHLAIFAFLNLVVCILVLKVYLVNNQSRSNLKKIASTLQLNLKLVMIKLKEIIFKLNIVKSYVLG